MMSKSTNHAALEIIRLRAEVIRIRKSEKTCKIAIQIIQETKDEKVRYLMRWENPNTQRSWSWADDVSDELKKTFYTSNTILSRPTTPWEYEQQSKSLEYINQPTLTIMHETVN